MSADMTGLTRRVVSAVPGPDAISSGTQDKNIIIKKLTVILCRNYNFGLII
jgi:hypothetical protein